MIRKKTNKRATAHPLRFALRMAYDPLVIFSKMRDDIWFHRMHHKKRQPFPSQHVLVVNVQKTIIFEVISHINACLATVQSLPGARLARKGPPAKHALTLERRSPSSFSEHSPGRAS